MTQDEKLNALDAKLQLMKEVVQSLIQANKVEVLSDLIEEALKIMGEP